MAAYVHCNFHSCILRMQVDVSILLPEKERMEDVEQGKKGETFGKNKKYQTLYLLHGFTGDHLTYLRTSKIERYADEHQIMVVMPSVYNSAYTDMKYGLDYFSYLTEELTDFVERNFPAATKRENLFIAGMSMGGYGAYKWGPERRRKRYSEIVYLLRYRGQTSPGFGRSEGVCGSAGRSAAV